MRLRVLTAVLALCASLTLAASALIASAAPAAVSPADAANIQAYLLARDAYARALVAAQPASSAALEGFTASVTGACPGALEGVPGGFETLPGLTAAPRVRGRWEHGWQRLQAILQELDKGELEALYRPAAAALETLIATEASLHWSDARLAALAEAELARERERLPQVPPELCHDLATWRQSNFRTLPAPAQRNFEQEGLVRVTDLTTLDTAIAPLESPSERRLATSTQEHLFEVLLPVLQVNHLEAALGLGEALQAERDQQRRREREPVAATGTTASGRHFEVKTLLHPESRRAGCKLEASVELSPAFGLGTIVITGGSAETNICLRGPLSRRPPVPVCEEGAIEVGTLVPRATHSVELRLSDGRTIVSQPAAITARLGGPALVYVQAVQGPRPIPVSLTELDARGRALRAIALRHVRGCHREPTVFPTPVTLAQGTAPDGRPFAIEGTNFGSPAGNGFHPRLLGGPRAGLFAFSALRGHSGPLQLSVAHECPPTAYSIVYGVLAPRAGSVLASVGGQLVPLTRVAIPAHLHSHGSLVYGVFSSTPSQLLVKGRSGRTLRVISLAHETREEDDYCSGWAEG
jgi:hypothetical protein